MKKCVWFRTKMRKLFVALPLLCVCAIGCGEKYVPVGSAAPDCSAAPAVILPTPAQSEDLSALDPARCPEIVAEDLHGAEPQAALRMSDSIIQDKAFYLFTLLDVTPGARAAVSTWPALAMIATERAEALQAALDCSAAACRSGAVKWSDADIERVGDALVALHATAQPIQAVANALRVSGHAQLHAALPDAELLRAAWKDAAHALNEGWDDHVAGLPNAAALLADAAAHAASAPFYAPALQLVLAGLDADNRDEAARYEPLAEGENAAAVQRIACLDFNAYPFAAILVPGEGPMTPEIALDPTGRMRADLAAGRLAAGLAPLIVLSGGHVHPDRTRYAEAIEMKHYLMSTYSIPEAALLVDPHARHTTTNLRNVGRLLYRYGVPTDRPSLITSDVYQAAYIGESGARQIFGKRCLDELGYFPYRGLVKLDLTDLCWIPSADSLHSDATDLLDP